MPNYAVEVVDPSTIINSSNDPGEYINIYFRSPTYFNPLVGDKRYKVVYPGLTLLMASACQ